MESSERPQGDPAFAGDDRITHEPVVEEERQAPLPGRGRPFPWALVIIALVLAGLAVAVVVGLSS